MMRDLRVIADALAAEIRALGGYIREPQLWVALICGLALWALAYQVPYSYRLHIGGNREARREGDDKPFLDGFSDAEPDRFLDHPDTAPFRWASDDATIRLPGIGGGRWNVTITATSGRPDKMPIVSVWDDGATATAVNVQALPLNYQVAASADAAGDLTLHFATPPFKAPGDNRTLGLVMYRLEADSTGWARMPAARQLALLAAALALAYALARRLACGPRGALGLALGLAALAAGLLLRERMALTLLSPRLVPILAGAYLLGVILDAILRSALLRPLAGDQQPAIQQEWAMHRHEPAVAAFVAFAPPLRRAEAGAETNRPASGARRSGLIVGLVTLALVLRLVGMLHPHATFSDVGLNTNNLRGFIRGQVYFTEGLPSEAGGGRAPYPPAQYIVMAPAQLVIAYGRDATGMLLKIGNALWDSLVVGLLWYVLRRSGYGARTALMGAALYVLPPPMLKSLSVGELANVFGQALALPLLALLAVRARELHPRPILAAVVVLLAAGLLGHLGVTISLFCLLGYLGLVWLIRLETRRAVQVLIGASLLAGLVVALFYYTAFADVLAKRLVPSPTAAGEPVLSVATKLRNQINALPAYGIHPLAVAIGAVGAGLVALRPRRWQAPWPRPALGSLLIAWWGGTLLSLGLLLFASQGVRWQQFLYPAMCLGAAPTLAALWSRGRAGRLIAAVLLAFLLWYGLDFWVVQIRDYLHK
jgi:hypothetical protein